MKKIIFSIIAVVAVIGGVAVMSAYEAHVINVTAHIENALTVNTSEILFGTVFPQEKLFENITIALSSSFLAEDRVDDVDYFIRQKPKPRPEAVDTYFQGNIDEARHWCYENWGEADPEIYFENCYYNLCPYLSKHSEDENDGDLDAFHEMGVDVFGHLAKSEQDIEDVWTIDLDVPCFQGMCAQDWTHQGWELPAELESEVFGCDLWIEVTNISLPGETPQICEEKPDVMQVLDRSGSVASELTTLKNAALAFVTALSPSADGAWMGQTSFADNGSLDLHLSYDVSAINGAINSLVAGGYTNLYEGIDYATDELTDPTYDRDDTESPDFMVIITDGTPNRPTGADPEALAISAANTAKAAGITIYVVGVGTDTSTAAWLANNIATSPGHYYDAANYGELQAILEALASCEDPLEQACIDSGGTVITSMCCLGVQDFRNTCSDAIGACGCAPEFSHEVKACDCPTGYCFDGSECVLEL